MRIAADGRTLQTATVNEKFAQMADVYYLAEKQARKDIEERIKIQQSLAYKEYLKQEDQMRDAASKAREEQNVILKTSIESPKKRDSIKPEDILKEDILRKERDEIRYIRKREIERDKRIEAAGNKKAK